MDPRRLLLLLLCLALVAPLAGCGSGKAQEDASDDDSGDDDDSAEEETRATPVKVDPVSLGEISETIAASSTVESERRADIHVEVSGTIESVRAEEGDKVGAGAVLAVLKNPALVGELERAEASFVRADTDYQSIKGLYERGFVSRNEYDASAHTVDTARVTLEQARASHRSSQISSPIAGIVSMRGVRFGEAVTPPLLAFQVVDLSSLRVEVALPERDLARLAVGQEARVRSEILEEAEDVSGRIERISPVVDPASGTVKVTVGLDPGQVTLRPGMFVAVEIVVDTHRDAKLIPKRAVVYDEGEPHAFVVVESTVKRRKLELGFSDRDRVEVLGGLKEGDLVVSVGQGLLRDDSEVRVVE
ncbi:MAG: efflux RND transporter periplasmic adaptor subunit [Proteobacteria bacterium]|nr:efflux RND transporter periplasmic adaptor subunit [Pseudomonadota bacterium]